MALTPVARVARPVRVSASDPKPTMLPAYHYAEAPGLYLTEWAPIVEDPHPRYSITHAESGARVGPWVYLTRVEAEAAMLRALPFFDWRQGMDVLRAELDLRERIEPGLTFKLAGALEPPHHTNPRASRTTC